MCLFARKHDYEKINYRLFCVTCQGSSFNFVTTLCSARYSARRTHISQTNVLWYGFLVLTNLVPVCMPRYHKRNTIKALLQFLLIKVFAYHLRAHRRSHIRPIFRWLCAILSGLLLAPVFREESPSSRSYTLHRNESWLRHRKKHMEEARKERVPCDIVKSRCDIDNAIE